MQQHELRQPKGATHKRKRVGRGNASGHGTYSGKGMKGQKARAGGGVRPYFEGGQLPLVRRMARKRGFRNPFRIDYEEVNVSALGERFAAGATVDAAGLRDARLIRSARRPVKVLGDGEIAVALTVEATNFTRSAIAKIEGAGGSVRWLNGEPARKQAASEADPAATPKAKRGAKAPKANESEAPAAAGEEEA
jgi:large subunit ribosomal protein L15